MCLEIESRLVDQSGGRLVYGFVPWQFGAFLCLVTFSAVGTIARDSIGTTLRIARDGYALMLLAGSYSHTPRILAASSISFSG